jgi:hypothetical protein
MQVEVRDVFGLRGSKTVVELVVSTTDKWVDLYKAASDLMDQVERNRAMVDDPADLMRLISRVEVKGHDTFRLQWNFKQLVVVVLIMISLAHYYGAFAFGVGTPVLGLRGSIPGSPSLRGATQNVDLQPTRPTQHVRGGTAHISHSFKMLEPMTVSVLVLGCVDDIQSRRATTRKAEKVTRRAAQHAGSAVSTLKEQGAVAGTCTLARASIQALTTQALLSADEDEHPVRRTILDDLSEGAIDVLDKSSMHITSHANFLQKTATTAMKAAHALEVMAAHNPIAAGLASIAIISAITISMSHARPNDERMHASTERARESE